MCHFCDLAAVVFLETDDADVKIADFGFAKRIKDLTPKETACGTPGYVAPEILRGDRYQAEVDIWSMGVICYVLLAGYPPFYDEDQKKLFKKIKEGRYHFHEDYWSNTSKEAINMIQNMLCVDQKKRWTAEQLLEHPWIKMGDETLQAKDLTGSINVMKKFNARRRLRAAADAVIMANRMSRIMGKGGSGQPGVAGTDGVKKHKSLIDMDLLNSVNAESSSRLSENDHSQSNPVLDLLNDKDLSS
jgi:calcium/calmodulin-dependent protein kinase I